MPVSTSAITIAVALLAVADCAFVVMAQAGSTLMLDRTLCPLASMPGARRYHWPASGVAVVCPSA